MKYRVYPIKDSFRENFHVVLIHDFINLLMKYLFYDDEYNKQIAKLTITGHMNHFSHLLLPDLFLVFQLSM